MSQQFGDKYSGLTVLPGVRFAECPLPWNLTCPFCGAERVALLAGKLTFTAKMSGDDILADSEHPLAGMICEQGHLFFVRESDILPDASSQSVA